MAKNGWHHNLQAGSSQIEEISTQNTATDLDGTKNISLNYNSMKFLDDNTKLKLTGYTRKTDSGYDSWDDGNANADNIMYAFQANLEKKENNIEDTFTSLACAESEHSISSSRPVTESVSRDLSRFDGELISGTSPSQQSSQQQWLCCRPPG